MSAGPAAAGNGSDSAQARIRLSLGPQHSIEPRGALFTQSGAVQRGEVVVSCAWGERYRLQGPAHLSRTGPAADAEGAFDCNASGQVHRFQSVPGSGDVSADPASAVLVTFF